MVNDVIKDSQLAVNVISLVNGLHVFFNVPKLCEVYKTKYPEEYPGREVKFLPAQIVVRYYYDGRVTERCYNMQCLVEFDAEAISTATQDVIQEIIDQSGGTICSLGADGASVMSGQLNGVAQRLRTERYPWLVYIHCTAHRSGFTMITSQGS